MHLINSAGQMTHDTPTDKSWEQITASPYRMTLDEARGLFRTFNRNAVLILEGGVDVNPTLYNEENRYSWPDELMRRDMWELGLIELACEYESWIWGNCRGCQILNVSQGGTLWQDIGRDVGIDHRSYHDVKIEGIGLEMFDPSVVEETAEGHVTHVNSYHHQAVRDLGAGGVEWAWCLGKGRNNRPVIEGVYYPLIKAAAAQWHFEFMDDPTPLLWIERQMEADTSQLFFIPKTKTTLATSVTERMFNNEIDF